MNTTTRISTVQNASAVALAVDGAPMRVANGGRRTGWYPGCAGSGCHRAVWVGQAGSCSVYRSIPRSGWHCCWFVSWLWDGQQIRAIQTKSSICPDHLEELEHRVMTESYNDISWIPRMTD